MLKIGLTGGIGSGKTTVANLFKKYGATIIDSDEISHKLTAPNTKYYTQIVQHFGKKVVRNDGELNRALMREIIFADKLKRQWLEQLLHPVIITELTEKVLTLDKPYCIAVVPLLVESSLAKLFDRILVVNATEKMQLERTIARDHSDYSAVKQVIQAQTGANERLEIADDVISNNGNLEDLEQQVKKFDHLYRKLSK